MIETNTQFSMANHTGYNRIFTLMPSGRPVWIEVPAILTAEDKAWLLRLIDLFLVQEVKAEEGGTKQ